MPLSEGVYRGGGGPAHHPEKDINRFRLGDLDFASRTESSILGGACLSAASLRTIEGSVSESGEG